MILTCRPRRRPPTGSSPAPVSSPNDTDSGNMPPTVSSSRRRFPIASASTSNPSHPNLETSPKRTQDLPGPHWSASSFLCPGLGSWLRWGEATPQIQKCRNGSQSHAPEGSLAVGLRRGATRALYASPSTCSNPSSSPARGRVASSQRTPKARGKDMRDLSPVALGRPPQQLLLCSRRRSQRLGPGLLRVRGDHASHRPRQQDFVPPRVRREIRVRSMCLFRGCDH